MKLLAWLWCLCGWLLAGCGQSLDTPLADQPITGVGGPTLVVPNFGDDSLSLLRVEAQSGALQPLARLSVAGRPKLVVLSGDHRFAYVTTQERGISGFQLDPPGQLPGSPFPESTGIFGLALHPSGRFLVGCGGRQFVTFALGSDGGLRRLATLPVNSTRELSFNPPVLARGGRYAYAAGGDRGVYGAAVDPQTGALSPLTLPTFGEVRVLAVHPRRHWLALPEVSRPGLASWFVAEDGGLSLGHQAALNFNPVGGAFAGEGLFYLGSEGGRGIFGFAVNPADGDFTALNSGNGWPAGARDNNFLVSDRAARLLFVSARGTGQVFGFHIQPGGGLSPTAGSPTGGFAEPDWPALAE